MSFRLREIFKDIEKLKHGKKSGGVPAAEAPSAEVSEGGGARAPSKPSAKAEAGGATAPGELLPLSPEEVENFIVVAGVGGMSARQPQVREAPVAQQPQAQAGQAQPTAQPQATTTQPVQQPPQVQQPQPMQPQPSLEEAEEAARKALEETIAREIPEEKAREIAETAMREGLQAAMEKVATEHLEETAKAISKAREAFKEKAGAYPEQLSQQPQQLQVPATTLGEQLRQAAQQAQPQTQPATRPQPMPSGLPAQPTPQPAPQPSQVPQTPAAGEQQPQTQVPTPAPPTGQPAQPPTAPAPGGPSGQGQQPQSAGLKPQISKEEAKKALKELMAKLEGGEEEAEKKPVEKQAKPTPQPRKEEKQGLPVRAATPPEEAGERKKPAKRAKKREKPVKTLEQFLKPVPPRKKRGKEEERPVGQRLLSKAARELEKAEKKPPKEVEEAARELIGAPPEMYSQLVMKTPQGAYVRIATVKIELPTEDILSIKQQFATGKRYTIPATPEELEKAKEILSRYYKTKVREIRRVSQLEKALTDKNFVATLKPEEKALLEELLRLMNAASKIESFRTMTYRQVLQPPLFFKSPYMEDWLTLDLEEALKVLENVEKGIKKLLSSNDVVYAYARRLALAAGKLNDFLTNPEIRKQYLDIARKLLQYRTSEKRVYVVPNYQPLPVAVKVLEAAKHAASARLEDILAELEAIERGEKKATNKKQKLEEKEKLEKLIEKLDSVIEELKKLESAAESIALPA